MNSQSQMEINKDKDLEEEEVECIDLTTDTNSNSENSYVTVEVIGRQIEKIEKIHEPKYKVMSVCL